MSKIEHKTSGEIFEDVFNNDTLDNKNKLWISKDSLISWIDRHFVHRENIIYINMEELLKELENKQ